MSGEIRCEDCRWWLQIEQADNRCGLCTLRMTTMYYYNCDDAIAKPSSEPADVENAYQRGFTAGWCGALNEAQKMLENQAKKVGDEQ